MARISEVEYQPVETACFQLMSEGTNPSFEMVYNIIGRRGSAKVVQDMIGRWRKETADRFFVRRSHPVLPENLVAASDQMVEKIWVEALTKFDSVFAEKLKEIENRLNEMQELVDAADKTVKTEEKSRLAAESDLKASRAENVSLLDRVADLDVRLREATTILVAREGQIAGLREGMGRMTATLESEQARLAEAKSQMDILQSKANAAQEDAYFHRGKVDEQKKTIDALQAKIMDIEQTLDRNSI